MCFKVALYHCCQCHESKDSALSSLRGLPAMLENPEIRLCLVIKQELVEQCSPSLRIAHRGADT